MFKHCLIILVSTVTLAPLLADDVTGKVTNRAGEPLVGRREEISTAGPKVGRGVFGWH